MKMLLNLVQSKKYPQTEHHCPSHPPTNERYRRYYLSRSGYAQGLPVLRAQLASLCVVRPEVSTQSQKCGPEPVTAASEIIPIGPCLLWLRHPSLSSLLLPFLLRGGEKAITFIWDLLLGLPSLSFLLPGSPIPYVETTNGGEF